MQATRRLFSPWRTRPGATAPSHNKIVRSITISHTPALFHSPAPAVFRIRHGTRETREFVAGKVPRARRRVATVTAVRQVFCLMYESMRIITRIKMTTMIIYALVALVGEKDVLQMNWQISHSVSKLALNDSCGLGGACNGSNVLCTTSSLKLTICRRYRMW